MINTWYPEKVCDKLANLKKNDNGIEWQRGKMLVIYDAIVTIMIDIES
jgi:hypothetical protein